MYIMACARPSHNDSVMYNERVILFALGPNIMRNKVPDDPVSLPYGHPTWAYRGTVL